MVKVKVCGITNLKDAEAALLCGADALGFVFAPSPRRISAARARQIIQSIGPFVTTVGVFVNESVESLDRIMSECRLSAAQLHGDETAGYTKRLGCCKVIKAFRVDEAFRLKDIAGFPADAYLFDTKVSGKYGGSGKSFDWKALSVQMSKSAGKAKPVIVSGGLHPGNVRQAIHALSPYAVDVSSGVEKKPGVKDHKLLKEFIHNAKKS